MEEPRGLAGWQQRAQAVDVETAGWIALALETVFGWFFILGVGHAYAGRLWRAIGLLVGWWLVLGFLGFVSTVTLGVLGCIAVPVWIVVPVVSGLLARRTVLTEGRTGSWGAVLGLGGAGCLVILTAACLLASVFGVLGALLSAGSG
ncbi:hypothetical protein OO015_11750 [Thermomicrobium sp. 4228-Ro]|uniref:hypothetical protein n=1 Tax=Thermomicrobium sp. 4228-Ro TaxID=2993937 RepID=UPI002248BF4A|nr:hypothetical protein [Thermomicrobium sp. 4228-Ro]MCX2728164.1 hypothetical protein [Thermomicrobium sp. 4228-Ro]